MPIGSYNIGLKGTLFNQIGAVRDFDANVLLSDGVTNIIALMVDFSGLIYDLLSVTGTSISNLFSFGRIPSG